MIARCLVVAVLFAAVALGQEAPAETTPAAAVEATTAPVEGSGAAAAGTVFGYGGGHPGYWGTVAGTRLWLVDPWLYGSSTIIVFTMAPGFGIGHGSWYPGIFDHSIIWFMFWVQPCLPCFAPSFTFMY